MSISTYTCLIHAQVLVTNSMITISRSKQDYTQPKHFFSNKLKQATVQKLQAHAEMGMQVSSFLHLHEIVEGLYFCFSLSVWCVCVCLSVCEQNPDRTATPILARSSLNSFLLQSFEPY